MTAKETDFLIAYNQYLDNQPSGILLKTHEVCKAVANNPAPRFYVTAEEALRQYRKYKKTGTISSVRTKTQQMYLEIFRRYEEKLLFYGSRSFKYSIMSDVLESQAPCFYLESSTAFKFYYRAMANKRKEVRNKL